MANQLPAPTATMDNAQCDACSKQMGASDRVYCNECYHSDADASACLGLDPKSKLEDVHASLKAIVDFRAQVLAMVGSAEKPATMQEAIGKIAASLEAAAKLPNVTAELTDLRASATKAQLRATLEAGLKDQKLSLGSIQATIPVVLRGAAKEEWKKAMAEIKTVNAESVLEAACNVPVTDDDVSAIGEYAKAAQLVAAPAHNEPDHDAAADAEAMTPEAANIAAFAKRANEMLDKNSPKAK